MTANVAATLLDCLLIWSSITNIQLMALANCCLSANLLTGWVQLVEKAEADMSNGGKRNI